MINKFKITINRHKNKSQNNLNSKCQTFLLNKKLKKNKNQKLKRKNNQNKHSLSHYNHNNKIMQIINQITLSHLLSNHNKTMQNKKIINNLKNKAMDLIFNYNKIKTNKKQNNKSQYSVFQVLMVIQHQHLILLNLT